MWTWHHIQCENIIATGKFECPEFYRASGDVVCEKCDENYFSHPQNIPYHFLRVLCNGDNVKL